MITRTSFWAAVALLFCGSVTCFGYAGLQTFDLGRDKTSNGLTSAFHSPIHFERHSAAATIESM